MNFIQGRFQLFSFIQGTLDAHLCDLGCLSGKYAANQPRCQWPHLPVQQVGRQSFSPCAMPREGSHARRSDRSIARKILGLADRAWASSAKVGNRIKSSPHLCTRCGWFVGHSRAHPATQVRRSAPVNGCKVQPSPPPNNLAPNEPGERPACPGASDAILAAPRRTEGRFPLAFACRHV